MKKSETITRMTEDQLNPPPFASSLCPPSQPNSDTESASKFSLTSLTCNKCSVGLLGVCMNAADEVCITNKSSCFTGRATFPSLTSFVGFNTQGCLESIMCNTTTNATLLGATYTSVKTCCDSNKCNPVTISGATSAKLSYSMLPHTEATRAAQRAADTESLAEVAPLTVAGLHLLVLQQVLTVA
ncbi:unnamed protein product, partial [Coregonus sp. 'balchen']